MEYILDIEIKYLTDGQNFLAYCSKRNCGEKYGKKYLFHIILVAAYKLIYAGIRNQDYFKGP